ncbi:MBL fold metallo-hydrolase [Aeromicrobium phragmitis]|uniref:MBL fold metallo-hydrolase n=1 Tax=Aeromicrobium phragmitis TaxID=2478914 RepID=A0A3L8PJK3_9ACTN|nr:MBL fold metallo-hydrolase [Aeromicrobium phragmitis]RLV54758.1 MBL fold metallo-hydrolase [Aeromicrobium phragmitis]
MENMLVTRFGHAAVLVETEDARVLLDPGVFSVDEVFELERLDAIVVTHQHPDHLDRSRADALLARNRGALLLADPQTVEQLGAPWRAHRDGDRATFGSTTIAAVGELHAEIAPQLPRVSNVGVLVRSETGPTIFHPGDSYATVPADVDVLALPLSAPWAKVSETIAFAQQVAPAIAFPIHDRTISDAAYDIYWNHVANFGGVADLRRLGQTEATQV